MNPAFEALLQPINAANPVGSDGYNAISDLEAMCLPRTDARTENGQMIEVVQEPNWSPIRQRALQILQKESKHLRAAMILAVAAAKAGSWSDLADAFQLIERLLKEYWGTLRPLCEPQTNDPFERGIILSDLSHPINTENDPYNFLLKLQLMPILESPRAGRVSYLDHEVARGAASAALLGERQALSPEQVAAALQSADPAALTATGQKAEAILQSIERIAGLFAENGAPADSLPRLELLADTLRRVQKTISPASSVTAEAPSSRTRAESDLPPAASGAFAQGGELTAGGIHTRAQALRALDEVVRYYRQAEPSSPVPLLLRRAQALAEMNFYDIVGDLTPEALDRLKIIVGDPQAEGQQQAG